MTTAFYSENFEVHELDDGIFACIHKMGGQAISNAGIVDLGDATLVFDCFISPEVALEIPELVKHYNLPPIKYVINSHYHNDHIRGNQVFGEDVKIISTKRTAELIEYWEPKEIADEKIYAPEQFAKFDSMFMAFKGSKESREFKQINMWRPYFEVLSRSHEEVETTLPNSFIDKHHIITGSKISVELMSLGSGHTESDLVLYIPEKKILFSGDIVFTGCHPYLGHGSVDGLYSWLNFLLEYELQILVPGHGEIGDQASVSFMIQYLDDLKKHALSKDSSESIDDFLKSAHIPKKYEMLWFERFYTSNLKFMLNQMK